MPRGNDIGISIAESRLSSAHTLLSLKVLKILALRQTDTVSVKVDRYGFLTVPFRTALKESQEVDRTGDDHD